MKKLLKICEIIIKDVSNCLIKSFGFVAILFWYYTKYGVDGSMLSFEKFMDCFFLPVFILYTFYIVGKNIINQVFAINVHPDNAESLGIALPISKIDSNKEVEEYNRKILSVHEAGHAVLSCILRVESFDVVITDTNPRVVSVYRIPDAEEIKKLAIIYYGGCAAEEIMFGKFYGCSMRGTDSDFIQATEMIKSYIVMTEPDISKSMLNEETREYIINYSKEFYEESKKMLLNNKGALEEIAKILLMQDTLSRKDIESIVVKNQSCC